MFPSEVGKVKLNIQENQEIVAVSVAIKKTETILLNQEHYPCVPELESESIRLLYNRFLECSKDRIWQSISQHVKCTVFGFDSINNNSGLPMCDKESSAGLRYI
jgi:hypothetical protein